MVTEKVIQGKQEYKAVFVVQGCQEDKSYVRTDVPTGVERRFLHEVRNSGSRRLGYHVFDVQSAYLQSIGIERLLFFFFLRMPHRNPPPGTKSVLEAAGFVEFKAGTTVFTACQDLMDLRLSRTHTSMIAFRKSSKTYKDALKHLVHTLHVKQQSGTVVHCGWTISKDASHIR